MQYILSPLFLYFYTILGLLVPNVALCFTEQMPLTACVANVFLPLFAYSLLMSMSAKIGRQVWILFLLVFFAAFQMVLIYLYGSGVIAVDMFLNLLTTNPGEAMELLDNLVPAVAGVFILYLPLLVIAAIQWTKHIMLDDKFRHTARRLSLIGILVFATLTKLCYYQYPEGNEKEGKFEYRLSDNMYPINVFYNLGLAVKESWRSAHYQQNVAGFRFNARTTHAKDSAEVYVLVIGETARSANFQLYGYHRPTNPQLMKTPGLIAFKNVRSQSNTTHKSVPMLLSAATAEDHDRLYSEKGLIAAFREAGFHTVFLSNQRRNHSYIDFLGSEANYCHFIRDDYAGDNEDDKYSDELLLPYVQRVLDERHNKLLVVLHTYGSHFNYRDRYAQSNARFLPDTPTEAKAKNRPQLLNAYDNTILQTDRILAKLIGMLRKQGCASTLM